MKKIILGLAILATGLTTSCSGFLEEEPVLKQSNELTLANYTSLDAAAAGLYSPLQSYTWYGASFILASELRCGNAKNPKSLPGSGRYRVDPFWNYNESSTSSIWSYANYTISRANNVINNLDGKESSEVTAQQINNTKAEALFMRALSLFDLVITYAQPYTYAPESLGVPVVLVTENGQPARNTVKEVYDQIVNDLTTAESIMADDYARAGVADAAAAATKPAIQALLSRVYLYMGDWQKSADYATKVINNGKYKLAEGNKYKEMFTATTAPENGEIIFEVYGSTKNEYWDGSGWEGISYITNIDPNGSGDVSATKDLVDLYEEGDIRREMFTINENDYFTTKYAGKTGSGIPKENNIIILRLSEMYLNRAEALYNGAHIAGVTAQSDLETISAKRGSTAPSPSATSIFTERRKELAFEGHIAYDYARTKTSLVRTDYDGISNKDIPFPSEKWAMPIPKREMDANPNMQQNPGY